MSTYGPYSPIRKAGDLYFVSGQVGINPETKKSPEDIAGQTHQTMKNLKDLLNTEGLQLRHLAKTTIFLADVGDFETVNEIYATYFDEGEPRPARACVGVEELPRLADTPLLIEIEAVAYKE